MRALFVCCLLALFLGVPEHNKLIAQAIEYTVDKEFHRQRREALRNMLPPRSVAVFFANPVRNRANDVDYHYHPDPDLFYLTGFHEPNAVLLLFSEAREINGKKLTEQLFVQPRNPQLELWNGRITGPAEAKKQLGIAEVQPTTAFAAAANFAQFDQVLFLPFQEDVRDNKNDEADLYSLMQLFKERVQYPADFDAEKIRLSHLIHQSDNLNQKQIQQQLEKAFFEYPHLQEDAHLQQYYKATSAKARNAAKAQVPQSRLNAHTLQEALNVLRETKTPEEIVKLRRAIEISAIGQVEVMKAMRPGMSETETQGIHEFVYRKYGLRFQGYPSIVGAGNNGCVLHYTENNKLRLLDGELILMDCGAEYDGYTADVTRTIPVNGKFTQEQKQIYELVLAAQEAGFAKCKTGNDFGDPGLAAQKTIAAGLKKLGIISKEEEARRYFPHGTSHYLGLDVHDRGTYGKFKPNTVITVEPGIYIPDGSPCDKKWWGIGVRIEDDILITETGYENLSKTAPRTVADIEATMAQPSSLDNFILPEVK